MTTHASQSSKELAVPFVDLGYVTGAVRTQVIDGAERLMDRGAFVNGEAVSSFEDAFRSYCEIAHCVGVASGLDAIRLGLHALDIVHGDEVIVPAMTFIATYEAVAQVGATPVPVDVRSDDCCIDPARIEAAITPRTRAIVPVHLYGQMADVHAIRDIARRHGLRVLEDAAQAHGASRVGTGVGALSDGAAFSFYPSKNLGAMGDAGAFVTNDAETARRVLALRQHGETERYRSQYVGYTSRLDALQAIVLSAKLPHLDVWNEERQRAADAYREELAHVGDLRLPEPVADAVHAWHLFTIRTADPDALGMHLARRGIATGRHYPEPPPYSRAFADYTWARGAFPVAEAIADSTISLPIYPGITAEQIGHVVASLREYFQGG